MVQREIRDMQEALAGYIEATYHLSHPTTVAIRRALLDRIGGTHQEPYIESTPAYAGDRRFAELALPESVRSLLTHLAADEQGALLFDPPYEHQAQALEIVGAAREGAGVVVTTGTGSGKTEAFLLPILARLADEATTRPATFQQRAVRALLLYPMNALVNDQLGRLRALFGADPVRDWFTDAAGRPAKFGRYTGRTLYAGERTAERDRKRLKPLSYYLDLEDAAHDGDGDSVSLLESLRRQGRWPSKPDSIVGRNDGLRSWYGSASQHWKDRLGQPARAVERPGDAELFTRHEMQAACPDLLVTNYSMLEYMLLRPVERTLFEQTRDFFSAHPEERFIFVLDEAHLYRGANGTEVAYLIRRFLDRLELPMSRVTFICTSASFSRPDAARAFASQLTGLEEAAFTVLTGRKTVSPGAGEGTAEVAQALADCDIGRLASIETFERAQVLTPLLQHAAARACVGSFPRFKGPN